METRYVLAVALIIAIIASAASILLYDHRGAGGMLVDKRFENLVSGIPQGLRVETNAIGPDGWFKKEYTCDGPDMTPQVVVKGVPDGAKAVALVMYDPDAPIGTFIHWLAVASASKGGVVFPSNSVVNGVNDFRRIGYGGPCPPKGHGPHRYYILALALDRDPKLASGFTLNELFEQAKGHVVSWGYTMGRYQRG